MASGKTPANMMKIHPLTPHAGLIRGDSVPRSRAVDLQTGRGQEMVNRDPKEDTVIIGAGMAGLACARRLHAAGRSFVICEASDHVGGRVATDVCAGYRLDRGFQVLLTAYPEARRLLDYDALDLRRFYPGALVRHVGKWHRVADPFRHPVDGLRGAFNPIGSFADKLRVGLSRLGGFDFSRHDSGLTTLEALRAEGFSASMIERFFRPFLGGVFLENRLETTARKLEFVMRHFARGDTAIPALGMAEIPLQLAASLPANAIRLHTCVTSIDDHGVHLENGDVLAAKAVVIATEAGGAERLLGRGDPDVPFNSVACLYFAAPSAPVNEPILLLNGDGVGPINNLTVLSAVSSDYAPPGRQLISISVVDTEAAAASDLDERVRHQLVDWFGAVSHAWELLRIDRIPRAVPSQRVVLEKSPRFGKGLYQCGDHCGIASINTALASGTAAAEAVLEDFP
jgi:phytoene dehydrogenase-like protein